MDRSRRVGGPRLRLALLALAVSLACLAAGYMAGRLSFGSARAGPRPLQAVMAESAKGTAPVTATDTAPGTGKGLGAAAVVMSAPASSVVQGPVCTNTCKLAKNGVCNDGRAEPSTSSEAAQLNKAVLVECDLGTDCDDCGSWQPQGSVTWQDYDADSGPIAALQTKRVEVRVKEAELGGHKLKFAYTDPVKDHDVSRHMHVTGLVEPGISWIFYTIFKAGCVKPDGSRALFVDVGANFGWFTVLGAAMGCNVIAFEPVPHFRAFLEFSLHINGLQGRVTVMRSVVSHTPGQQLTMVVPSAGTWGTAGIDGLNIDSTIPGAVENLVVPSVCLDDLVQQDVLLLKVDVEGWEWSVLQGAQKLMTKHDVQNVILEYSPGVAERSTKMDDLVATVQMLVTLTGQGYRLAHLGEGKEGVTSFDAALPKYEEVTPHNLKYDLHDAEQYKKAQLGCIPPPELRWPCSSLPEDASPRSLRSIMGHNTNIWAARNSQLQQLKGTIGMLELTDPPDKFTVTKLHYNTLFGMGMRHCIGIQPQYQVRHRCPCSNKAVCGAEEELVHRFAKEGKMPSNYVLKP